MSSFSDMLIKDLSGVFFQEFAEPHLWGNSLMDVIVDDERVANKYAEEYATLPLGSHTILARSSSFQNIQKKPRTNDAIIFDGSVYTISEIKEEAGLMILFLSAGRMA